MRKLFLAALLVPALAAGGVTVNQTISDVGPFPVTAKDVDGSTSAKSVKTRFENLVGQSAGWVNVPGNYAATGAGLAQAATDATARGVGVLVSAPVTISTALGTIAAPLQFGGGGKLVLASGGSVTITGALTAGLTQIFDTSGGGTLTFQAKVREVVPQWWGAKGDGVTDDTAAIQAAANVIGPHAVDFPPGTYLVASSFTIPAYVLFRGAGQQATFIKRGFTGDLVTSFGSYAGISDLTIDGNTATWGVGRGVLVPSNNPGQYIDNASIKNFSQSCLEFAADSGSGFSSKGATFYTTGAAGYVGAVRVNGTDTAANPRNFLAPSSGGCTLFDFGGANGFSATGFYTNGLLFGSTASKVKLYGMRLGGVQVGTGTISAGSTSLTVATGTGGNFSVGQGLTLQGAGYGGTQLAAMVTNVAGDVLTLSGPARTSITAGVLNNAVVLKGADHVLSGVSAAGLVVNGTGMNIEVQAPDWAIPDLGSANTINLLSPPWTPTITGTSGNPALGTGGALNGRYSRRGGIVNVEWEVTLGGAGFSPGAGTWEFDLPVPGVTTGIVLFTGSAYMADAAGSHALMGIVRIVPGTNKARIFYTTGGGPQVVGATPPANWNGTGTYATGDYFRFSCTYRTP